MEKRVITLFSGLIVLLFGLIWRIAFLGQTSLYSEAAARQSTYLLQVHTGRGGIFDRNGEPMVNRQTRSLAAVLPLSEGAAALRDSLADLPSQRTPTVLPADPTLPSGNGCYLFSVPRRYSSPFAAHLIGYLDGAGQGQSGIERAYDAFLSRTGRSVQVRFFVDAVGRPLPGEQDEILYSGSNADGLVLTVDSKVQRICETVLSQAECNGAVVVMDVKTGQLLAMASTPVFDPSSVADALNAKESPFINRATAAWAVGSSFKLITAAAALEQGILPETVFCCDGYLDVDGQIFRCNRLSGHGELDMTQAMASSCNCYFIQLAQQMGARPLFTMAQRFGFGQKDRLAQDYYSTAGTLPSLSQLQNPAELANLSFGQGYLTATPIQICKMVAAIAAEGRMPTPQVVMSMVEDGVRFPQESYAANAVIRPETAQILLEMMRVAVEEGTGAGACPSNGTAAGKTASAQTGQYDEEGREIVHGWFAGCVPAENPQYAAVVFLENGQSGNRAAAPVFRQITEEMLKQ